MTNQQKSLFLEDAAPWEVDDAEQKLLATIVFPTGPAQAFDYVVPDALAGQVEPGRRVRVPLGRSNRAVVGYCVEVGYRQAPQRRLKSVADVYDTRPLLTPSLLRLTRWMADRYLTSWGQALDCALPLGVRTQAGTRERLFFEVAEGFAADALEKRLPKKQAAVMEHLAAEGRPIELGDLLEAVGCTRAPVDSLRAKGLIVARTQRVRTGEPDQQAEDRDRPLELNRDQHQALETVLRPLEAQQHEVILLHGITGSGKTEVYMQAIQRVVEFGRQAIVLVPEISLTPQTRQRFRSRFDEVAVLHSHLSDGERSWHWDRIARGEINVVVGARSAVFAPTPRLGLIVIDEEHEASFKQDSAPRYHARDVALERARDAGVPLVLGSATPSLESFQRSQAKEYRIIDMPRRVLERPLPRVTTIDLRNEVQDRRERGSALSRPLRLAMQQALEDGEQIILLLNRRGFSTHIQCPGCGFVVRCPSCDISLTHHRDEGVALCHYCEYQSPAPMKCPECSFGGIRYSGIGTQKLEAEVHARFPEYPCLRMDRDAMQKHGSHEKALAAFRAGDVRILLGTQMIAKGLDFPNVTLVGVVNADTALHLPDFRAAERTFQLLVQVAGRTGRGDKGGRVLLQTFSPEHPAIQAAVEHDYNRFAREELPVRQMLGYPPFASLVRVVIRGPVEIAVRTFAEQAAERLSTLLGTETGCGVRGPASCPLPKLRGLYRFHFLAAAPQGETLLPAVTRMMEECVPPENVQWIADVDPVDML